MSKHGIELEVQVKKSRWDNSTCHHRSVISLRMGPYLVMFSAASRPQSPCERGGKTQADLGEQEAMGC